MQQVILQVEKRQKIAKGINHQLRLKDSIPGVVYGGKVDPLPIQVGLRSLHKILSSSAGENVLISMEISDGGESTKQPVIIKELQTNPISREFIHADFYRISLDKELTTHIPVVSVGIPVGVQDGGILEYSMREIEIKCLPTLIPDKIEFDVTAMKIGHTVHISDLRAPEGVTLLDNPENVVMTVVAPKAVVEEVVPTEVTEPELITKGPTEEELLEAAEGKEKEAKPEEAKPGVAAKKEEKEEKKERKEKR